MKFCVTNVVNAGKKLETKSQYFDIYLHNKKILEYGLLLVGSGRFMISHIEGRSNNYHACAHGTLALLTSQSSVFNPFFTNVRLKFSSKIITRK